MNWFYTALFKLHRLFTPYGGWVGGGPFSLYPFHGQYAFRKYIVGFAIYSFKLHAIYHFITRYFLVQFIKTNVLSRESPPISQTKQTVMEIEPKTKTRCHTSSSHSMCTFFGSWIQRSNSFFAVFKEQTKTLQCVQLYRDTVYLRHNLLVGQVQHYAFRHKRHRGF